MRANELLPQIIISKYYIDGIFKKGRTLMSVLQSPAIDRLNIKNIEFRPKKLKGDNLFNRLNNYFINNFKTFFYL